MTTETKGDIFRKKIKELKEEENLKNLKKMKRKKQFLKDLLKERIICKTLKKV